MYVPYGFVTGFVALGNTPATVVQTPLLAKSMVDKCPAKEMVIDFLANNLTKAMKAPWKDVKAPAAACAKSWRGDEAPSAAAGQ